ncbi:MAG: hypothetical protein V4710_12160 [Verrucomicrobiota bacterium]
MNKIMHCALALGIVTLTALAVEKTPTDGNASMPGWKLTSDYSLKEPFAPKELRKLTENPSPDERRLMLLILRAGIEKDQSFQDLLGKPNLRKAKEVDLALSGYDYMLNRSEAALDHLLAQLATEEIGADVDVMVVLQTLDEWDRTIRAFRKHFIHTDGAGGQSKVSFTNTRAYLYPKQYEKMRAAIETPIKWPQSLLPEK